MNAKKIVILTVFFLLVLYVTENPILFGLCKNVEVYNEGMKRCVEGKLLPEYIVQLIGFLSLSFLSLSIITYFLREEAFRAWWRFARWWALVIVAVTVLLENAGGGGGIGISGAVSEAFDILVLGVLYAVFILVSLIQIVRVYLKTK